MVETVLGGIYFEKCYCPGADALLARDALLRNEMYRLRREGTLDLPVYFPPGI